MQVIGDSQDLKPEQLFRDSLKHHEKGDLQKAIVLLKKYLEFNPNSDVANYNIGLFLSEQWAIDDADVFLKRALELNPKLATCYSALGSNQRKQGLLTEAENSFRKALQLDPNHTNSHFNLASLLLLQGKFEEGWKEYRWRLEHEDFKGNKHSSQEWTGQSLKNKTILLLAEQGFGDIIQSLRYVKRIKTKSTLILIEAHAALLPLLNTCEEIDLCIEKGAQLPKTDYHIPIMGIPAVLQENEESFALNYPYIKVAQSRFDEWKQRLGSSKKLRIGIAWQGNPEFKKDQWRSIPLTEFATLSSDKRIELVSLQKGEPGTSQIKAFTEKCALTNIDNELDRDRDFMDTAAIMANMDLIICSDNGVAHLAGALGVPTWVLLSSDPDWRWMLKREDSPWYPSMRLFRQKEHGNWSKLFLEVQKELTKQHKSLKQNSSRNLIIDDSKYENLKSWYQQAQKCFREGDLESSTNICNKILAIAPSHIQCNHLIAMIYGSNEDYKSTFKHLKRIIQINPQHVQALSDCGLALYHLKRCKKAEAVLKKAIEIDNTLAAAHHNLGLVLNEVKKSKESESHLRQAIKLSPDFADSYYILSFVLGENGELNEAIETIRKAIRISPSNEKYFALLTQLYLKLENIDESELAFNELLKGNIKSKDVYMGIGILRALKGEFEESIAIMRKALAIDPEYNIIYSNLGYALEELQRYDEAEEAYRKALLITPEFRSAHFNLAHLLLKTERFKEGWEEYRWRKTYQKSLSRIEGSSEWTGEDLSNKSIVVIAEQGLGDMIQTVRYIKRIKQKNTTVILETDNLLIPLFSLLPEVDQFIPRGEPLPSADFHIPLFNIPAVLQEELEDFSTEDSYLSVTPEIVQEWKERLGEKTKFRIGIAWQGNPKFIKDKWRSIPLEEFNSITSMSNIEFISLQKGNTGTDQIAEFKKKNKLTDVDANLEKSRDFLDTAAIILNLDLVISSDTSVAHLAGALGAPTWVLLSTNSDWRWMIEREDSPWYPSIKLFRQKDLGNWKHVFQNVKKELTTLLKHY